MANLQEHRDKTGKLPIHVHHGRGPDGRQLKPWTAPPPGRKRAHEKRPRLSPRPSRRNAGRASPLTAAGHSRIIVIMCWKQRRPGGVKHSAIVRYRELTTRIYPAIGHIKLKDLRADHLNALYTALGKDGTGKGSINVTAKVDHAALLKSWRRFLPSRIRIRISYFLRIA